MNEKPLFIPLKAEYYEAFDNGSKKEEYRPYGPRWNERTCRIGRRVTISYGYGKNRRRTGMIVSFDQSRGQTKTPAWQACYGGKGHTVAACIGIKLDPKP